ncbi:N-acetylmuramoyl-L-alanine amidase [Candidatus Pelagibacter ubique]|jgi:N-acetylmuramoyl-L-alanine amidase|uniref:N-acetylmuramoyl-L-alanine amidase n=1 Tax=Pelagibacter ubique (strain HTCC1062) TaxID=335992 RepID=Q4FPN2_PELUB|nr:MULTISPECIES: N-acetylmuramoyl-L-alanine amidase [Pelagibacter]MDA7445226.1 N-acetylmuramoyl-L-alanine amidase [Candidatus Pelagibacter ubique]AAZ20859.1 probable N-acetylmuramoyl-L-alanine amidase [Candidatus Pelagibacter ubique HTCC1062]MDA7446239.1 N-acetylmuramoyl-L-alanine amidase [Candidatus Pelagibacter ubique]MDA7457353.1 N-acetylmuramoyl-L-alanine amidase [Candidatus Pelagibacter ubique]MDA7465018.1 N-acetylmuramoyl-L-alanine amidase [Candidatus Pelagibacter ubique]
MALKTILNYSPNFNPKKRTSKQIKFIIFHYTGMKSESDALKRLTEIQSEVSCHYLIKNNGEIVKIVPDLYIAWHAGKSSWKNYKSLNQNSIGIEITNPGHEYGYKNFTQKQITTLVKLSKFLIKKYKINPKNILGHSDIAVLRKKDPGEKFPWEYLAKNKIGIWHTLNKQDLLKNRKLKISKVEENIFFRNLFKIGYSKTFPKNIGRNKYLIELIKSFQRRFRQELVDGKIDQESLLINKSLIKAYN